MTGAKIRISLILHTGRLLFSALLTSFVPWTFAKTSGVLLVCADRSTCNRGEPVEMSGRVLRDPHSLFASDRTAGRKSWMADGMNGRAVRADELTVRHRRCAIYDARMTAAGIRPAVYEHPDCRHAHAPPACTMRPVVVPFRHRASQVAPLRAGTWIRHKRQTPLSGVCRLYRAACLGGMRVGLWFWV